MYKTILSDPPWLERGAGKCKRGADRHYPLMSLVQIKGYFKVNVNHLIAADAHLYLWVTNNFLKDGLELMDWLGFRYITNIVWVKDKFGLGQYFRGKHELCLFGVRGAFYSGARTECTVIKADRTVHSKKPYQLYSMIEKVSAAPYLEVFARDRREGWDVLGLEAPDTIQKKLLSYDQSLNRHIIL